MKFARHFCSDSCNQTRYQIRFAAHLVSGYAQLHSDLYLLTAVSDLGAGFLLRSLNASADARLSSRGPVIDAAVGFLQAHQTGVMLLVTQHLISLLQTRREGARVQHRVSVPHTVALPVAVASAQAGNAGSTAGELRPLKQGCPDVLLLPGQSTQAGQSPTGTGKLLCCA